MQTFIPCISLFVLAYYLFIFYLPWTLFFKDLFHYFYLITSANFLSFFDQIISLNNIFLPDIIFLDFLL